MSAKNNKFQYRRITDKGLYVMFFIWPFAVFWKALQKIKHENVFGLLLLFGFFFGLNFVPAHPGSDGYSIAREFESIAGKPFSVFWYNMSFALKGQKDPELFQPFMMFATSLFTDNPRILFAFFGLFFTFFYLKVIHLVVKGRFDQLNFNAKVFLFYIILLFPITQINAVRWFTGLWVFLYGVLLVLDGDKKKLWVPAAAGLVHFSFYLPAALFITYSFLGNRNMLYFILLGLSFPASSFSILTVQDYSEGLGETIEARAYSYTNEGYSSMRSIEAQATNWYVRWKAPLVDYLMIIAVGWLLLKRRTKKLIFDKAQENLFSFLILYSAFVNFVWNVQSLGGRMRFVWWVLLAIFFTRFFLQNDIAKRHWLAKLAVLPITLWALVEFRASMSNLDAGLLFFNPLISLFTTMGVSIHELISLILPFY